MHSLKHGKPVGRRRNMGMYSLIEDNVEKFYSIAEESVGECEHLNQFIAKMKPHTNLLQGSGDEDHFEDLCYEMWNEKWSKYNA